MTGTVIFSPLLPWPLLAVLIVLGLHSTRDRTTSLIPLMALPFLALAGLANLLSMPDQAMTWASYAPAYVLGAIKGWQVQGRYLVSRDGLRVELRGEWITFIMMMLIFWSSYALGVMAAIAPQALAQLPLALLFPVLEGVRSGFFLGRLLCILRRGRPAQP